jgi:heparan-sulfate lyase
LENSDSKTLLWKPEGNIQILVTENQSYEKLKHRRSIFFVEGKYFVIVDEAVGAAKGMVKLHYQMPRGKVSNSRETMHFNTEFEDGPNMKLQCFGPLEMTMEKGEGWVSTTYQKKQKRMNASFNVKKSDNKPVRYITVIVPKDEPGDNPKIKASFINEHFNQSSLKLEVKVGKNKKQILSYEL